MTNSKLETKPKTLEELNGELERVHASISSIKGRQDIQSQESLKALDKRRKSIEFHIQSINDEQQYESEAAKHV